MEGMQLYHQHYRNKLNNSRNINITIRHQWNLLLGRPASHVEVSVSDQRNLVSILCISAGFFIGHQLRQMQSSLLATLLTGVSSPDNGFSQMWDQLNTHTCATSSHLWRMMHSYHGYQVSRQSIKTVELVCFINSLTHTNQPHIKANNSNNLFIVQNNGTWETANEEQKTSAFKECN